MKLDAQDDLILFEKGSTVGRNAPDKMQDAHNNFKKQISRFVKGRSELASTKRELLAQLQDVGGEESRGLGERAVKHFEDACETRDIHIQERQHGLRGAGQALNDSLFVVSRFAAAYSDILDAVTSAAGPYAQVGWQTMSILLIVVVNKKKNEEKLQSHMDRIHRFLPRLRHWKDIYRHQEIGQFMQELVSKTYDLVIEFSREVVEYLCHFWKRQLPAIIPTVKPGFDDVAQSIYQLLAEVNATANVGLHARTQNIESHVENLLKIQQQLREDNETLQNRLDRQAKQEDERRFHRLEQLLQVSQKLVSISNLHQKISLLTSSQVKTSHPGLSLGATKSFLQSAFPETRDCSPHDPYSIYEQMYPGTLLSLPTVQAWAASSSSSLLFIKGHTQSDGRRRSGIPSCWLSPAAVHIYDFYSKEQNRVAFFSCRPGVEHPKPQAVEVLAATALKLVSMRKEILRDILEDLEQIIGAPQASSQNSTVSFVGMTSSLGHPQIPNERPHPSTAYAPRYPPTPSNSFKIEATAGVDLLSRPSPLERVTNSILAILAAFSRTEPNPEKKTTYIVLDRLDSAHDVAIDVIMNELARIVSHSVNRVKVVVVVETSQMEGQWRVQDVPEHWAPRKRLFELNMDQQQLDLGGTKTEKRPRIWANAELNSMLDRP